MKNIKMNRMFISTPRLKSWAMQVLLLLSFVLPLLVLMFPSSTSAACHSWWNRNKCTRKGCYYWNSSCHWNQPSCTQPNNQNDCELYGYYWYSGSCHCDPMDCEAHTTEATCEAHAGCYWFEGACHGDAPTCDILTIEAECDEYGCYWWNSACHAEPPSCEAIDNESDCIEYGCNWYDAACHHEPPPAPPEDADMPCAVPPFLSEAVTPNVLIIQDNSGSMNYLAYPDMNSSNPEYYDYGSYSSTFRYYGLADADSYYVYNSTNQRFEVTHSWVGTADPANYRFSGNFLNWMLSRRIDISRQVLIGGQVLDRDVEGRKTLVWEDPLQSTELWKYWWCDDGCRWRFKNDDDNAFDVYRYSSCSSGSWSYKWNGKKRIIGPVNPTGFIQETSDRVRYGIMHFNNSDGGYVSSWIGSPEATLVSDINDTRCEQWTPLAETFYEATRYYQAISSYYNSGVDYSSHDPVQNWCQSNFVILITDGESTQDLNVPSTYHDYDNDGNDPGTWGSSGSDYLDDVGLWAHITDLRTDFDATQNLTLFTVYCFGAEPKAIQLLQDAAQNGAFNDLNESGTPDETIEYDSDADGDPDGYYGAANGWQLADALTNIFLNIMRQTSSGAAVSVVSTSDKGEGNVFQAYFSPARLISGTELEWVGELHALWIDQMGNLREDTNDDDHLILTEDRILHIYFSQSDQSTLVERWDDNDGDCEEDAIYDIVGVHDILSVWRAGDKLWNTDPDDRNIKVTLPTVAVPGSLEFIDFVVGNQTTPRIMPHLSYSSVTAEVESLINYIRGEDYISVVYWRGRTADSKAWKLSDIVNSSPTYVAAPADRYDLVYNDLTYREYFQEYKDRQGIVYVGSNDGMLHVFNAGRYIETGNPTDRGYLDDMGDELGEELMAIVPFNLLPHLKWLANYEYCHVYYADLKPKCFDARIFDDDDKHPRGWGTVLVCGMRFGGSEYVIPGYNTYTSAYMALDITNPDDIELLWEETYNDLAFTTSYPGVAKCDTTWFVLAGSGPTSYGGSSSQQAKLFVADVADPSDSRWFSGSGSGHFADATPVDIDLDSEVDVIYIGESYWSGGSWYGKIYKISTDESDDLSDWTISEFMSVPGPITAGCAITMDDAGNLWLYFGSGRYYSDTDEGDHSDQYFVGVKDPDWASASSSVDFSDLIDISTVNVQQTDSGSYVYYYGDDPVDYDSLLAGMAASNGWKMTLTGGERVINRPLIIGGVVFLTSYVPDDDICSFGGSSRLYGLDYRAGVPGETSILGMDEDGWLFEYVEIGEGVPSAPAAHIGLTDDAMIAIQLSTGAISQQSAAINSPKSKGLFWRGK